MFCLSVPQSKISKKATIYSWRMCGSNNYEKQWYKGKIVVIWEDSHVVWMINVVCHIIKISKSRVLLPPHQKVPPLCFSLTWLCMTLWVVADWYTRTSKGVVFKGQGFHIKHDFLLWGRNKLLQPLLKL